MIPTIVLAVVIFGLFALVLVRQFKKAKSGETSCSCGCSGCSSDSSCNENNQQK